MSSSTSQAELNNFMKSKFAEFMNREGAASFSATESASSSSSSTSSALAQEPCHEDLEDTFNNKEEAEDKESDEEVVEGEDELDEDCEDIDEDGDVEDYCGPKKRQRRSSVYRSSAQKKEESARTSTGKAKIPTAQPVDSYRNAFLRDQTGARAQGTGALCSSRRMRLADASRQNFKLSPTAQLKKYRY